MELNGIEYIELNMRNYIDNDVSQLNAWAIEAYAKIAQLEAENKQLKADVEALRERELAGENLDEYLEQTKVISNLWRQIVQIQVAMVAGGITIGKCMTCGCEVACDALTLQFKNNVHCRSCVK